MQPVYLIASKEPDAELWKVIERSFSGSRHYFINETMALIAPDPEQHNDAGTISSTLGFTDESERLGFVFLLETPLLMAGRFYNSFWEWIGRHGQ